VLPGLVVIGVFHIGAISFDVIMSFTDWSLGGADFIGIQNYIDLLTNGDFYNALIVTLFFVIGTVPVTLAVALPLAYMLHTTLAKYPIYRVLIFTPYIVPTVAGAMVFQTIFGPTPGGLANALLANFGVERRTWLLDGNGVFNILLNPFGIELAQPWSGPSVALVVVMVVQIWHLLGFTVVVLLGALANLDPGLSEAARMDGASGFRIFRSIAMPLVMPTILFLSVALIIFSMREFNLIYVLTGGGPFGSTETLSLMMVRQFWEENQLGLGATTAIILALAIIGLSWIQFKFSKGEDHD
jgi:multiple sugar transport system permease protein